MGKRALVVEFRDKVGVGGQGTGIGCGRRAGHALAFRILVVLATKSSVKQKGFNPGGV